MASEVIKLLYNILAVIIDLFLSLFDSKSLSLTYKSPIVMQRILFLAIPAIQYVNECFQEHRN